MLEIIRDIIRYFARWFHNTHCKSNCGASACDCDNMAETSSSSGASTQAQVSHRHNMAESSSSGSSTQISHDDVYNHHRREGTAMSHTYSTHS